MRPMASMVESRPVFPASVGRAISAGDGVAIRGGVFEHMQAVIRAQQADKRFGRQLADLFEQCLFGRIDDRQVSGGEVQHQQQDQIVIGAL